MSEPNNFGTKINNEGSWQMTKKKGTSWWISQYQLIKSDKVYWLHEIKNKESNSQKPKGI